MATMTLNPRFFELDDIRAVQGLSWIPLRQNQRDAHESPYPGVGGVATYTGVATLAVPSASRSVADNLDWSEVDPSAHRPSLDEGVYRPVDLHCDGTGNAIGTRMVIAQEVGSFEPEVWHLHPDLIIALKLVREGDTWFRPNEGWAEVARLKRDGDGSPMLLEIRAEMLSDYLAARDMALFVSSYHERAAYFANRPPYSWVDQPVEAKSGRDSREKYITEAEFPPDPTFHFRGLGALWRTEWFSPGALSTRVRSDREPGNVTFAVGTAGERKTAADCVGASTYIAFQPSLIPALMRYRGGHIGWYSRDTGGMGAASHGIHFGVNHLGLVTIFAKDIAKLDAWEQRAWAAHSTPLDGGVSKELFDAQMQCNPATTVAPETQILLVIEALDAGFQERFGKPLLRDHASVDELLRRVHRFRAVEEDGLLALSKELNRLLMERVDVDVLREVANIPAKDKIGSLKAIERLLGTLTEPAEARTMMGPLFGINDLRNADAHLGSSLIESGFERAKVDRANTSTVDQGRQLLSTFVETVGSIGEIIARTEQDSSSPTPGT